MVRASLQLPRNVMTDADLAATVDAAWEDRESLGASTRGAARDAVEAALDGLDAGRLRVAEKTARGWQVHQWLKKAGLVSFRLNDMVEMPGGPAGPERGSSRWLDKVPSKFAGWSSNRFRAAGFRAVPGCFVRRSAYIAPNVVLMPSFVDVGGYVDSGTMVDTWATVGSCAQIGKNCHLSGGVGIGGVLEPPNAVPVVVEDDAFIGSRSMIVDGARVHRGAKLGAGTMLTATTHVIDVQTGEELPRGEAPAWSVCVSGMRSRSFPGGGFALPCVLVLARLAEGAEHDKLALNDILRDHGVNG